MKHLIFRIILCGLLGYPIPAFAQVELIAHPNEDTTRVNGPGSTFYEFQGKVYFNTSDQLGGAFYVTDGTTAGTRCITRDIYPMGFASCGDWLYIYGSKPQYSQSNDNPWGKFAIWRMKADGSDREKLVDLFKPYSMSSDEFYMWTAGTRIYYSWRGGLSWIDNGTGLVTKFYQGLRDNDSHRADFHLEKMAMSPNGVFFLGQNGTPVNFFFTPLTDSITIPLATIKTIGPSPDMDNIRVVGNSCYVLHVGDTIQLWRSDGTPSGTVKIWQNTHFQDGNYNPFISYFFEYQSKLIFDIPEKDGDLYWHSIYACTGDSVSLLYKHPADWHNISFVRVPNALYVFVKDEYTHGNHEIWRMDQTGYYKIKNLNFGFDGYPTGCWMDNMIIVRTSGSIYFLDDQTLNTVFSTGKNATNLYPTSLGVFYTQYYGYYGDPYVLKTNPPSCSLLKKMIWDLEVGAIEKLTPVGNQLFFRANTAESGRELYVTGANSGSTHLVKELNDTTTGNNTARSTNPSGFAEFGNKLVFTATGPIYSSMGKYDYSGLWLSDGSEVGTVKIEDLVIKEESFYNPKVVFRDKIYFIGKSKAYGDIWKLYVTNGNPGEARIFDESFASLHFTSPYGLKVAGDLLYFMAVGGNNYLEIWETDGTEAGTRSVDNLIEDKNFVYSAYFEPQLLSAGSKLFFTRDRIATGANPKKVDRDVWVTDGTAAGSKCLADFGDGFQKNMGIQFLGTHKDNLVFTYATPGNGMELWYSGSDRSNTVQLTGLDDIRVNSDKDFSEVVALGDQFFFVSFTEENGKELWVSDGTPEGTHIFMELAHGQQSTCPRGLVRVGNHLVFFCVGEGISDPLWITDGTLEGTEPLPWNFTRLSNFKEILFWQGALYFVASHPDTGQGLYRYELPGTLGIASVLNPDADGGFIAYPNPAKDIVTIELSDKQIVPVTGKLLSQEGRVIREFVVDQVIIVLSVSGLPSGFYLIQIGELSRAIIME